MLFNDLDELLNFLPRDINRIIYNYMFCPYHTVFILGCDYCYYEWSLKWKAKYNL